MPRGKDTRNHPNRQVSRHSFGGGGYVEILRSPELQNDIDVRRKMENIDIENLPDERPTTAFVEPDQANPYGMERPVTTPPFDEDDRAYMTSLMSDNTYRKK